MREARDCGEEQREECPEAQAPRAFREPVEEQHVAAPTLHGAKGERRQRNRHDAHDQKLQLGGPVETEPRKDEQSACGNEREDAR